MKNKVQLIGNVGNTPEIKEVNNTKVAHLSIATNEIYKNAQGERVEQTEWHKVVAWGRLAEIIEKYVTKGKEVAIEGKLTYRSYDDKEGNKRYVTEIVANDILLLGRAK
ncbi:single-stranded DNA-binding protein [Riemerella anatipestifer]|nr:single-stranded DNA-binding protein [Riemerella anatipestifer]